MENSNHQAASGAGAQGMTELEEGTKQALDGKVFPNEVPGQSRPVLFAISCRWKRWVNRVNLSRFRSSGNQLGMILWWLLDEVCKFAMVILLFGLLSQLPGRSLPIRCRSTSFLTSTVFRAMATPRCLSSFGWVPWNKWLQRGQESIKNIQEPIPSFIAWDEKWLAKWKICQRPSVDDTASELWPIYIYIYYHPCRWKEQSWMLSNSPGLKFLSLDIWGMLLYSLKKACCWTSDWLLNSWWFSVA